MAVHKSVIRGFIRGLIRPPRPYKAPQGHIRAIRSFKRPVGGPRKRYFRVLVMVMSALDFACLVMRHASSF